MSLRKFMYGVSVVMGVSLLGSGGGSSTRSPFAGTYVGAFTESGLITENGEFAITIGPTGAVTVRSIDLLSIAIGISSSGHITEVSSTENTFTGSVTINYSEGIAGNKAGTATGSLTLNTSTGIVTGSVTNNANGQTTNFPSGLSSTAQSNSFAGLYSGTYTINGAAGTPANRATLIINGNGKITGFTTNSIAGQINTGAIVRGTVVSDTGSATIGDSTGTLTLTNGVLQGDLINSTHTFTYIYRLYANE